jgi:alpha-galactosidase
MARFLDSTVDGHEAYPAFRVAMGNSATYAKDKSRFQMMRRLGFFVTESLEHMAEYVLYLIKRDDLVREFDIPIDEYVRRSSENLVTFEKIRDGVPSGAPIEMKLSHECAAYTIRAIEANVDWSFNGNVPNSLDRRTASLVRNFPANAIVEVPILTNRAGLQPCHVGELPGGVAGPNRTHSSVHHLAVEAALTGNRDAPYQAVMLDPHTASVLSLDETWPKTDELVEAHGHTRPTFTPRRLAGGPGRPLR